jgi:pimeloyl-ACP methyl ester carboxylesterase
MKAKWLAIAGIVLGTCIAIFLVIILTGILATRPLSEEMLRKLGVIEPDSLFVDVEGVKTRYVVKGRGEQSIILIHGFSSSLYTWRQCLGPLSEHFRVIALDLKGFGYSDKPPSEYSIGDYVEFLNSFMDSLGIEKTTLCGNSMGGIIAWRMALKYPRRVDKLILVDSGGYPSERTGLPLFVRLGRLPGADRLFSLIMTRSRVRDSLESAYYDDSKVTEKAVDVYYYALRTEGAMHAPLAEIRAGMEEVRKWETSIRELNLPTLVIWGTEDSWIPRSDADRFQRDITGSTLALISDCGHLPQEERPEIFTKHVLKFMFGREGEPLAIQTPFDQEPASR